LTREEAEGEGPAPAPRGTAATAPALRILREVLPVEEGDGCRLVLDIESWTHLYGWSGDAA
jgi:hypothetical protein